MNTDILYRRAVLAQLEAAYPAGLPSATIAQGLALAGFDADAAELERQLQYLREKQFAESVNSALCPSFVRTKITARGLDYLQGGEF